MSAVPVVTALRPVVGRADVGEFDHADALDALVAVLHGAHESERCAVARGERLAVEFEAEQCLRMKRAGAIEADVVAVRPPTFVDAVDGRGEANVLAGCTVLGEEVRKSHSLPGRDSAPTFNAFKLGRHRVVWQRSNRGEWHITVGGAGDMDHPVVRGGRAHQADEPIDA